jgi:cephalosporin-C deacetylase
MSSIDMSREELEAYAPDSYAPVDLDDYWAGTIRAALEQPLGVELEPYPLELAGVRCSSVRFEGFGGGSIAAWYLRPVGGGAVPGVAVYHGYGGRAPRPLELYPLAAQGVAVLAMDCRAQDGESSDRVGRDAGHFAGWMTDGVRDPEQYYYRYVYADAVRALEVLCSQPGVDGSRVAVTGISQGGGLSLAAAALSDRPCFVWSDIPFLCDIRRGVEVAPRGPYVEVSDFLRRWPGLEEQTWSTIAYVDLLNLADRVTCPTVVTVGLWDDICPPSTIYGTFRRLGSTDKQLKVQPFHRHELSYEIGEERLVALLDALGAQRAS